MIHTTKMALMLVAIVAVASAGFLTLVEQDVQATPSAASEQGQILGHITMVLEDGDGNIKAYRQTDNAVYNDGFNQLLDDAFGTAACSGCLATTNDFDDVHIGTGTPGALSTNILGVAAPAGCDRFSGVVASPALGQVTITASFGGDLSGADVANNACETLAITEAGLFNNVVVAGSQMFAAQGFSAINIVTDTDLLTVTWDITFS